LARCGFYYDGPLPDRSLRRESCRDIWILRRESLGNRLAGGLEDEGGAVDRVGERAAWEKLAIGGGRGASFKWASR
jgi:hypothetical protein